MRIAALSIVALAGLLTACVVEEGPRPSPPQPDAPRACTFEYAPVCGERRGQHETYGNACMARGEGARIVHDGECRRGDANPPPPGKPTQACTREYQPVCAIRRGDDRRTFGNACEAEAAGYRIIHGEAC